MAKNSKQPVHSQTEKRTSLKVRNIIIIGLLLLSLLFMFGIMGINFKSSYQNARNDVLELSKNSSEKNAKDIEMFFLRHEDVLLTSAMSLEYALDQGSELGDLEKLLSAISSTYNDEVYEAATGKKFTGIYASVGGTLIHGVKSSSELDEGYDPLERKWYKEGKAGGGRVVFGEPYLDTYDKDLMVMTATKLLKDGSTVIGMDITMDDLQTLVGDMNISVMVNGESHTYGYGFVMTENGVVMAHSDDKTQQNQNYAKVQSPMYNVFKQVKSCIENGLDFQEIQFDGTAHGLFVQKLSNGWCTVILTDLENINTTVSDFASRILGLTVGVAFITLLYCGLITLAYAKSDKLTGNLRHALDLAKTDALTGIMNRAAYDMQVNELRRKLKTDLDESFALIMLDLNDLKYVNDHYGHATGDRYIINSCELVNRIFPCDLYRIGGDEFALFLLGDLFNHWEIHYDRLKQAVADANLSLTPNVDAPSIAVGLAIHIEGGHESLDDLLRKADAEMYTNKLAIKQMRLDNSEKGKAPDVKRLLTDKQMLASEMKKGLDEEQFEVWFQPQVNHAGGGALIGAEALVRWRHPSRGMVSPAVFIPMFEYNGLIYELDKYVWKHTCAFIRECINAGLDFIPLSVNVSRLDILQPDFLDTIASMVEEYQIPANLLHLEVTESAFSDDTGKVGEIVRELISRGFIIAIDDFGSGYSSLSLLRSVPAHVVKLDMRFFADGKDRMRNECIIESMIRMVKMLGMVVIAEGVERAEQADLLSMLGCTNVQGFLYSRPLPYDEFVAYTKASLCKQTEASNAKVSEMTELGYTQSKLLYHNIVYGTADVVVIADIKTKQILFVNRAAEHYFGKRFDPLCPVTCAEFCGRDKQCENCPAWDIASGDRREYVTAENGKHLKTSYTQMDWNGHDAVVYYQIDITAEMQALEFSNALIQNIPGATVAFEMENGGKPYIRFISDNALKILKDGGMETDSPDFEDCISVIYPEDVDCVRNAMTATFAEKIPFRESFRIVTKNDELMWVELLVNPVAGRNGNYLFYGVYTDITDHKK